MHTPLSVHASVCVCVCLYACVHVGHCVLIPPARYTLIHSQSARLSCTCAPFPISHTHMHTLRTLPSWFGHSESYTHWIYFTPGCCGLFGNTHELRHGARSNRPGKLWLAGQPHVLSINSSIFGSILSSARFMKLYCKWTVHFQIFWIYKRKSKVKLDLKSMWFWRKTKYKISFSFTWSWCEANVKWMHVRCKMWYTTNLKMVQIWCVKFGVKPIWNECKFGVKEIWIRHTFCVGINSAVTPKKGNGKFSICRIQHHLVSNQMVWRMKMELMCISQTINVLYVCMCLRHVWQKRLMFLRLLHCHLQLLIWTGLKYFNWGLQPFCLQLWSYKFLSMWHVPAF